ncbi:MAG: NADH-quinone oxidoreductase subunit NuoG [Anaerolineales bacterium]
MSDSQVKLTIDGREVTVPKGTLIVDAAKTVGIDIPVFCYHPKMKPVGMCRMCLVDVGTPRKDRGTGEVVKDDDGKPIIDFHPKLETACTTPVSEGMEVLVWSENASAGRKQIVEYLLTSHPLDCPICDKGGECPLQNLTMKHGPGKSRFLYSDKKHLAKHVPLGELIFLDRERCIQCGRCVRFQEQLVDDPVIAFGERGRSLEIVTYTDPGFDSYFSGNTTDICPVGALTTADFRFGARPWELHASASICTHCPVGCNITLNTRREASAGGQVTIKRVMPRQNEAVNEIWICDKGRFAHHFATDRERLTKPLVRSGGELVETDWETALSRAAEGLRGAGKDLLGLAGSRASNEDLYNFKELVEGLGGTALQYGSMAGGDLVGLVGAGSDSNLAALGRGDAILVIASDLHEEAPIWWQRVFTAVKRGATLVVANGRKTRLDRYAAHALRYEFPRAAETALGLLQVVSKDKGLAPYKGGESLQSAARALAEAQNLIVFYGREGLDYTGSDALARACARLLIETKHVGRPNNGLIPVWDGANAQGAWDLGLRPDPALAGRLQAAKAALILAADPAGDDPELASAFEQGTFTVVQELYLTATAQSADVVLPARSFVEREGTFTNGMRRVQRFYPAVEGMGEARPDWQIAAQLGAALGLAIEALSCGKVFAAFATAAQGYEGLDYSKLTVVEPQWPPVGDSDLYFGGTAFKNHQGIGVQIAPASEKGASVDVEWVAPPKLVPPDGMRLIPIHRLYDHGTTLKPSGVLEPRLADPGLMLHPDDAASLGVKAGEMIAIRFDGRVETLPAMIETDVPQGVLLLGRSQGVAIDVPLDVDVKPAS